jgi:DNA-3-methyladenine glycosylase
VSEHDWRPFDRRVLAGDSLTVAPLLLNAILAADGCAVRIVEVEAYRGSEDLASHSFRGRTKRNGTMFGEAGLLYVYFTYGMHFCANVVCGPPELALAVLLRAGEVVAGTELIRTRRPAARKDAQLCAGPARLCQALAVDRGFDGIDLLAPDSPVRLFHDDVSPPKEPLVGPRIGLGRKVGEAARYPWRFGVPGSSSLSRPFTSMRSTVTEPKPVGSTEKSG